MGGWWGWGGDEKKTKLMLYSTLVEVVVKVEVELGNNYKLYTERTLKICIIWNLLDP